MAVKPISTLKNYFKTGDRPTESQFSDFIDSFLHKETAGVFVTTKTYDENTGILNLVFSDGQTITVNVPVNLGIAEIDQLTESLAAKVEKVVGKGLSANDYTNGDKAVALNKISDYVDDEILNGGSGVYHRIRDGKLYAYTGTYPFTTTDFATELAAGDWTVKIDVGDGTGTGSGDNTLASLQGGGVETNILDTDSVGFFNTVLKRITWANLKTVLIAAFNLIYMKLTDGVIVVNDFTALRAYPITPANGQMFKVKGHTEKGKGGGSFEWDAASTAADDNGVCVKATAITTGRFKRVHNFVLSIEDYGGLVNPLNDNSIDASAPYVNGLDYLIALGGGDFIIPKRASSFYVTESETSLTKNLSNIVIKGGGSIYVDGSNTNTGVAISRGTIIKIANGTTDFTVKNIKILVNEGCSYNNFINATICSEEGGSWERVLIKNVQIIQEARPNLQGGSHAISFFRDTTDISDTANGKDLTIKGCKIVVTGHSTYGIQINATVKGILIDNNRIDFTNDGVSSEAYNPIAIYGDSEDFTVSNNRIYGKNIHSGVAISGGSHGLVIGNTVKGITRANEAAFEFEYKQGHQTYLTDPDYQPKGVSFVGNTSRSCTIGYLVARREIFTTNNSTDLAPKDCVFSGNFAYDSTQNDVLVANNTSGTAEYTHRIKGIKFNNNHFESTGITQVYIADPDGLDFINNTVVGGDKNFHLGRSSVIYPIGRFNIKDNRFLSAKAPACVFVESLGDGVYIDFTGNEIDGKGVGVRGLQAIIGTPLGTIWNIVGNTVSNCTDGLRVDGQGANIAGSTMSGNYGFNNSTRSFDFSADNGNAKDNTSINSTNASTYTGTAIITDNNKEL
jgi:hypothetical protein